MEHEVYLCGWSKIADDFRLWLKAKPEVSASAASYERAEEEFLDAIRANGGAMQAVLEFDPPLPKTELESSYASPEIYLVCGDDRFQTDAPRSIAFERPDEREARFKWQDQFFTTPVCRHCARATGLRNDLPLSMNYVPSRADGAFGYVGHEAGTRIEIVSDEFLSVLLPEERASMELRAVMRRGKGRAFYEIAGPAGAPFVGIPHLGLRGWRCEHCGSGVWGHWQRGLAMHEFVAGDDLPTTSLGIFTVGTPPEVRLCMTGARWRELIGKIGVRGFASHPIGAVRHRNFTRRPELPTKEQARNATGFGIPRI